MPSQCHRLFNVVNGELVVSCCLALVTALGHAEVRQSDETGDEGGIAGVIGTGFNYQGVLKQSGVPFNGQAEFAFSLWDAPTGGNFIADSIPPSQYVDVVDGQFNAMIDFGPTAFLANEPRYMVVAVRVPPGTGSFTGLAPRQSITPTPWAMYALNGAGLTLPYIVSASANDLSLLQMTNTHPAGGGVYGNATVYGVAGDSTSGYGVLGRATQGNGYAVHGQNVPTGNSGSLGTGAFGAQGQHSITGNHGEIGTANYGVHGSAIDPGGYGVHGSHTSTANYGSLGFSLGGAYGQHTSSGNYAYLGTASHGVLARVGTTELSDVAVEGYHDVFNSTGRLGTAGAGVVGFTGAFWNTASLGTLASCVVAVLDHFEGSVGAPVAAAIHSTCNLSYGYSAYFAGVSGSKNYFEQAVGIGTLSPTFQLQLSTNSAAKPTSNTWTIASDERLKKDINTIAHALDDLLALRGVTYRWKDPASQGGMDGTYTGMIAQEVEKVFPEWVSENAEGTKHLTVIGFEGLVIEALRELRSEKDAQLVEQKQQLDAQQTELTALNEQIATLQAQVDALITTTKEHQQ